jgi:hypothetical protein
LSRQKRAGGSAEFDYDVMRKNDIVMELRRNAGGGSPLHDNRSLTLQIQRILLLRGLNAG